MLKLHVHVVCLSPVPAAEPYDRCLMTPCIQSPGQIQLSSEDDQLYANHELRLGPSGLLCEVSQGLECHIKSSWYTMQYIISYVTT